MVLILKPADSIHRANPKNGNYTYKYNVHGTSLWIMYIN